MGKLKNIIDVGWWWLRSPNNNNDNNAYNVNNDGNNNNNNVNNTNNGVVPDLLFAFGRAGERISDYTLRAIKSKGIFSFLAR